MIIEFLIIEIWKKFVIDNFVSIKNDFFFTNVLIKNIILFVILNDNENVINFFSNELIVDFFVDFVKNRVCFFE